MKKICLLFALIGLIAAVEAKEKKEPVVMTIAGKEVSRSEFIFMAKQGSGVDFKNKKSVEEFVELYKIMKLKVVDAELMSINQVPGFEQELKRLSQQLQESYLADKSGEDSLLQVMYERRKTIPVMQHIFFRYPPELFQEQDGLVLTKDTVALYEKAVAAWNRIQNGESFEEIGESLMKNNEAYYRESHYIVPFQLPYKAVEDCAFAMKPGDISEPIRSRAGYFLIKVDDFTPNPGKVRVAHILSEFPSEEPTDDEIEATRLKSEEIFQKALAGEDFALLAQTFSDDSINARNGGMIQEFGLGMDVISSIEKAAFALENIGDISKPVQSWIGFHVLKLYDRKPEIVFDEVASSINFSINNNSEYLHEKYRLFEDKVKERHGFMLHAEAFEELLRLADDYFPLDTNFINRGIEMDKPLVSCDSFLFTQSNFVEYLQAKHQSQQKYSIDFLKEVYAWYANDILTELEKRSLEKDYPEYNLTMQSYYDGTLLFEISNKRVWSRPLEDQERLEAEWLKELHEKYPVTINWKVIKKIKNV